MSSSTATAPYRLVPARLAPVAVPVLDASQRAVVSHPGGPLLVLAGPGTGKTTTLVEAVADRVDRGLSPEQILVLTFSRKAADELRERIAGRLGRTLSEPAAHTFHAFCSALVSAYGDGVPRLLSGPERLVRIRDLLAGDAAGQGSTRWPAELRQCVTTRGFAQEVADLLDRLRERALGADDLRVLARREGRDDWRAAADFFDEYSQVLRGRETDYAELVAEALRLLESDLTVLAAVRDRYRAYFIDEYQDTDPAQERMLQLLAGDGRDLVVVGDPDQSIYWFRGADVSCLLDFPSRFRSRGAPAPVLSLAVSRRSGPTLLGVSRCVAAGLPAPGLPVASLLAHRAVEAAPTVPDGTVSLAIFGTAADEATAIADLLRRAHLGRLEPDSAGLPMPWSEMAILVRSGVRSLPMLRRALVAAGVPVAVASDEVPIARDPAVAPLLQVLRAADDIATLSSAELLDLLGSPLVRASPAQLRRLGRALRARERADDAERRAADPSLSQAYPRPSA
ncbi:MAG: UvrD-helicase domain-containing protein, partial [Actinomycetota bacterium]|nr:UvrD-helicase domain-containing protein [Actinomycetota bacterium]